MCIYVYIYIERERDRYNKKMYIYIYIYIYIYNIERERLSDLVACRKKQTLSDTPGVHDHVDSAHHCSAHDAKRDGRSARHTGTLATGPNACVAGTSSPNF